MKKIVTATIKPIKASSSEKDLYENIKIYMLKIISESDMTLDETYNYYIDLVTDARDDIEKMIK